MAAQTPSKWLAMPGPRTTTAFLFLMMFAFRTTSAAEETGRPNFSQDIAPILFDHCASCHHPGGAAPFSVLEYQDVRPYARAIAEATTGRHMPPSLPERGYGDFIEERRLTDRQIATISAWVSKGTPEGPASELPPAPHFPEGWALGEPDLVVEAPVGITVPATGPDVFWNFILNPALKTSRYVRAIDIRTGSNHMVHHANLIVDPAMSARKREPTPGAGFPGMDLTVERPALSFDSHFLFWKPGSLPYSEPKGLSWRLDPGTDLVLNTHLKPHGHAELVRPAVGLYFTDERPTRFPMLLQLSRDDRLDIPAGVRDFMVADDFRTPADVDVLAMYPHTHYLGKLLEGFATLPNGTLKWLIRIPDWNQDSQAVYHYREPVFLPKGSVVSMRYHYDNSAANLHNPSHPPRRVQAGNQATDEMAHLWLQLLPRGLGDARPLVEDALMRHRIERNPADFLAQLRLGGLLMARLNAAAALPALLAAVRIQPDHAEAHNLLGAALAGVGRSAEAIGQFQLALRIEPGYSNARLNLAKALAKSGRLTEAADNFRAVLRVYPEDATAKELLARTLIARGSELASGDQREAAESCYREAIELEPRDAQARTGYALVLMREGKFAEALRELDQALAVDSSLQEAREARDLVRQRLAGH